MNYIQPSWPPGLTLVPFLPMRTPAQTETWRTMARKRDGCGPASGSRYSCSRWTENLPPVYRGGQDRPEAACHSSEQRLPLRSWPPAEELEVLVMLIACGEHRANGRAARQLDSKSCSDRRDVFVRLSSNMEHTTASGQSSRCRAGNHMTWWTTRRGCRKKRAGEKKRSRRADSLPRSKMAIPGAARHMPR